jgi:hypothetical protein
MLDIHCYASVVLYMRRLCAKGGLKELQDVMEIVTKVVNYTAECALKVRQFHSLLSAMNSEHKGLLMYNHVRCLNLA